MFLKGIQFDDEIEDEIYCKKLYEDYLNDPDPEKDETFYWLHACFILQVAFRYNTTSKSPLKNLY